MKIKIGYIELDDWVCPAAIPPTQPAPYRDALISGGAVTCVFIDCDMNEDGTRIYFPDFTGRFKGPEFNFLEKAYQYQEFASYEEAQEYVDKFLIRMNKLLAFA